MPNVLRPLLLDLLDGLPVRSPYSVRGACAESSGEARLAPDP